MDIQPEARFDQLNNCQAHAKVWLDDLLLARSRSAFTNGFPEFGNDLLIPEDDIAEGEILSGAFIDEGKRLSLGKGGPPLARRVLLNSRSFIVFDPAAVRIDLIDTHPTPEGFDATVSTFPRWGDVSDLIRCLDLENDGHGLFTAPPMGMQKRNVIEATQMIGQAIVAASRTIPEQRAVSAHIMVSRAAGFDTPLRFEVSVWHQGRTFSTVNVAITQKDKPIASVIVLLDAGSPDIARQQIAMPDVPPPDETPVHDCEVSGRHVRFIGGNLDEPGSTKEPEMHSWLRFREAPEELCMRQALLVHFIGRTTVGAAMRPHPELNLSQAHVSLSTAVLATTITLHEDPEFSDWLLYTNDAVHTGRGLGFVDGRIFDRSGRLFASASTQVLLRRLARNHASLGKGRAM